MSLTRINSNIQALKSLSALKQVNEKLNIHQNRIATGKRINSAAEDPAGYHLATKLESRKRGLDMALHNVKNAQNILNVAEDGYKNIMDMLQTIKEKATQAADYSLSSSQRSAIDEQVNAMISEVDDIVDETTFNGKNLINGGFEGKFHTGERAQDELKVSLSSADSAALNLNNLNLTTQNGASSAISTTSKAIDKLASNIQNVGQYKTRLQSKENMLTSASTNTEAVRSSIEDADLAQEQMKLSQLKIRQETALTALTQANSSPQAVLSLFGG